MTKCRNSLVSALIGGLLVLQPVQSAAADSESHEAIRTAATEFARRQIDKTGLSDIQVQAAGLDPRLRLAACEIPLEAFSTSKSGQLARTTVGVRCSGRNPWTLYVPVTIEAQADVVFTRRPLLRGEALTTEVLEIRKLPLSRLPPRHLSSPGQLAGMETTRPLQADTALTLNAVRARQLVRQGQEVVILAVSGGIQVRMTGVARRSGSQGDLIPVQNDSSGRTVEAEVLDKSTVRVKF
ncbi:MAG: flagellar basal body P-ring formation chaperone FlgA [Gammaproteobacteria bacterium]|nr:flagellar basal body P-ring formation protein FlgA [Pseudomonadales bacterium]MCP5349030.1 flagellar basal body P-ring formation protein FlgA [Pseudomonadales bacterium]